MALTRPKYSNFVDNDFKNSCRIVTTTSITLSGGAPSTYDGVTLVAGDRVLVAGQSTGSQNGIYVVATLGTGSNGTWTRSFDASDGSRLSAGAQITIGEGTYGGRLWRLSTPDPITIGSTSLTFLDGAAIAGGSSTQIQFNNSGSLQGVSTLTYVSANTSVVSSGNVFAATLYTDQLRWAANSQSITLTGNINPAVYIGNVLVGTTTTLIDSISTTGNTMVTWTTVSRDLGNSRYKKSTIDSFNDGSSVSFTESGIIRTNPAYSVAAFTSNITNGTINLWATGDSAVVTVTFERRVLGSSSPTGYINNFGPIGPAGSIAQTSSNIVTTATTAATSTTTGALQIAGGAGIVGNLYTGGNVVVGANLTVLGNLIVAGTTTQLNTSVLQISDLNITLANGSVDAAHSDGAGITIAGAGATFNYTASTDAWTSNKNIYASAYYTGGDIKWSSNSAVFRSGINYTTSGSAPINSNYGDQWYDTTSDILYEWQTSDGVYGFWVDISSLAIQANANLTNQAFNTVSANNITASANITGGNVVLGGVGSGSVYANNFIFSTNGASIFSSFGVNSYGNVNVSQYLPTYTGNIQAANVYVVGNDSISISTGALRVVGGVGINGNLFVDGSGNANGGIAVTGNRGQITIGNNTRDGSARYILNTAINLYSGVQVRRAGSDLWYYGADMTERYIIRYSSSTDHVVIDTTGNVVIGTTTTSTNTTTGALVVKGGAGIAGNVYTSGNIGVGGNTNYYNSLGPGRAVSVVASAGTAYLEAIGGSGDVGLINFGNTNILHAQINSTTDRALEFWINTGGFTNAVTYALRIDNKLNATFANNISVTANVTSGNVSTGIVSATGNVTSANITTGNASITSNLTVTQSGLFRGPYDENSTLSGVFVGNTGTAPGITPRVGFFNGNTQQNWQIDNNLGEFRWFVPGATRLSLYPNGNLNVVGSLTVGGKKAVNGPAFSAYAAATGQTITSGSQQKVLFQTEEFDTDNCYASSRFTPTVEGYYQLNAEVRLDGASGTGEMMLVIWKNGAEYKRGTNQSGTQIASSFWAMTVSSLVYANGTGDYFEIYVQQGSGSSVTVTAVGATNITWFNGAMVRGA